MIDAIFKYFDADENGLDIDEFKKLLTMGEDKDE